MKSQPQAEQADNGSEARRRLKWQVGPNATTRNDHIVYGVSATRPRDSYLRADQRVDVKQLERWPTAPSPVYWSEPLEGMVVKGNVEDGNVRMLKL